MFEAAFPLRIRGWIKECNYASGERRSSINLFILPGAADEILIGVSEIKVLGLPDLNEELGKKTQLLNNLTTVAKSVVSIPAVGEHPVTAVKATEATSAKNPDGVVDDSRLTVDGLSNERIESKVEWKDFSNKTMHSEVEVSKLSTSTDELHLEYMSDHIIDSGLELGHASVVSILCTSTDELNLEYLSNYISDSEFVHVSDKAMYLNGN